MSVDRCSSGQTNLHAAASYVVVIVGLGGEKFSLLAAQSRQPRDGASRLSPGCGLGLPAATALLGGGCTFAQSVSGEVHTDIFWPTVTLKRL